MIKANISWNAKQIAKAVTNGSMTFDNAIQRGHVWNRETQSLLVDSLIRNYPVPPMYTIKTDIDAPEGCKKGSKVFDCIDGKQRCEAIRAFRNNELVLEGLEPIDDIDINGMTYEELPEEMQDAFDSYTMTVYFFTDISDDEIADMMSRLNNGKPLTGVENARIRAKNLPAIIKLASHKIFTENMTPKAIKSYNNEDIVVKTALQVFENTFELSSKNVKNAYETLDFSDEMSDKLYAVFTMADNALSIVKEEAKKKDVRKIIKKTNLVNIIYLAYQNLDGDYEKLADFLTLFFSDKTFTDDEAVTEDMQNAREAYAVAFTNGTNHASNVTARNNILAEQYKQYANNN